MKQCSLFYLIVLSLLFSCSNGDILKEDITVISTSSDESYELSVEEAKKMVYDFVRSSVTKSDRTIRIVGQKKTEYSIQTSVKTRSGESIGGNVPVYEFFTENEGKSGFALVVADKRIQKVLAYSSYGSLNDTVFNLPLKFFVQTIPDCLKNDLEEAYTYTKDTDVLTKADDPTKESFRHYCNPPVTWGQGSPYNNKVTYSCPNGDPKYGGKAPAGCVAVALAQLMAYHKQPSSFNWNLLLSSPIVSQNDSESRRNEIARLMFDIGDKVSMIYDCDGSGSNIYSAEAALRGYGYSTKGVKSYNTDYICENILNNKPVYIRGVCDKGGHAWLITGWEHLVTLNPNNQYETNDYFRMNWGWDGSSNGSYYWKSNQLASFQPTGRSSAYEFNRSLEFIYR